MTSADLRTWRGDRSRAEAAQAIGCSERSILNWEQGRAIPRYIALAIAALQFDLPPYGQRRPNSAA